MKGKISMVEIAEMSGVSIATVSRVLNHNGRFSSETERKVMNIVNKYGYQKAQYRISPVNGNYYSWQYDNETGNGQDGYAGCFGVAMDRFQLF